MVVPSMDRIWIEGSSGRRQFLDRLTLSYFPEHAEISLSYEKAMRERNRLLKEKYIMTTGIMLLKLRWPKVQF